MSDFGTPPKNPNVDYETPSNIDGYITQFPEGATCNICGKGFSCMSSARRHYKTIHEVRDHLSIIYKCFGAFFNHLPTGLPTYLVFTYVITFSVHNVRKIFNFLNNLWQRFFFHADTSVMYKTITMTKCGDMSLNGFIFSVKS